MSKSLLITLFFPPEEGGMQDYLFNICKRLPFKKIVVLTEEFKDVQKFDRKQSFKIYRSKLLTQFRPKWFPLLRQTLKIAKKEKIKFIQCGQLFPTGLAGLFMRKFFKLPYSVYVHGIDLLQPQKSRIKRRIINSILSNASRIIANSHFTRRELLKLGKYDSKIFVINPGIDLSVSHPIIPKERAKSKLGLLGEKVILTVGRLIERKGFDVVIKALPLVLKKVPNTIYVIVGQGPYRAALQDLVKKLNLQKRVKFAGFVGNEKLPWYYNASDVFCMPNRFIEKKGDVEGFGIVFLEAARYEKPVIGGKSGGTEDAIISNRTGILVDPENIREIREALIKILTDSELAAKLGKEGRRRVEREFDWGKIIKKLKPLISLKEN